MQNLEKTKYRPKEDTWKGQRAETDQRGQHSVTKRTHFRKNRIAETLQKGIRAETLQRGQRRLYTSQRTEYSAKKSTLQKEQNR
jgi:hypothetical protein